MKVASHPERGSMIVMLFIFAAIFAALSFAVSRGFSVSSGESNALSDDKMALTLTELRDVVEAHRIAIQTMVLSGTSVDMIDAHDVDDFYPPTNASCASDTCRLYQPTGGGLRFYSFAKRHPELSRPTPFSYDGPTWSWWAYKGTTKPDLLYSVSTTKEFCEYINKKIGVTEDLTATNNPASIGFRYALQSGTRNTLGTYAHNYSLTGDDQAHHLSKKTEGCLKNNGVEEYYYVAFLYAT